MLTNMLTNMALKDKYSKIVKEYVNAFSKITDKRGYISDDYSMLFTEYEAWSIDDIRYVIDNIDIILDRYGKKSTPDNDVIELFREDLEDWINYNVDVSEFGISYINLKSWLAGAPRISQDNIEKIKKADANFKSMMQNFVSEYGKCDDNPQPEHLRNLKHKNHD